ncbi:MAG: cytochrome c3 family protein [Deltaproteobacteria bacterium]|nr:cytochrome c3 family protein [Deltaproteobacteria bacterium]
MKKLLCLLVSVLVPLCILVASGAQENMTAVDSSVFGKPERTRAVFRHESHNEKAGIDACNECHHVVKDGKKLKDESSEDRRCSDCHSLSDSGQAPSLRKAFHRNCKQCHEKSGKGPVMCGECHLKGDR